MRVTQAETGAAAAGGDGAVEHAAGALGRDAGALVTNAKDDVRLVFAQLDRHAAARGREGDGVQQNVREDLQDRAHVADAGVARETRIEHELDTATARFGGDAGDGTERGGVRGPLTGPVVRDLGADRTPSDAVAEARVRARDLERFAIGTLGQTVAHDVEPAEDDRQRVRDVVQRKAELLRAFVAASVGRLTCSRHAEKVNVRIPVGPVLYGFA
jgi:hypothetical protein